MSVEPGLAAAVDRLGEAFLARDVASVLACFVPDDDITYVGSESGESAHGRAAVAALFAELFSRPLAYTWHATMMTAHVFPTHAFVLAEAVGTEHPGADRFPYRVSGLLEQTEGAWLWRAAHGSEPVQLG